MSFYIPYGDDIAKPGPDVDPLKCFVREGPTHVDVYYEYDDGLFASTSIMASTWLAMTAQRREAIWRELARKLT